MDLLDRTGRYLGLAFCRAPLKLQKSGTIWSCALRRKICSFIPGRYTVLLSFLWYHSQCQRILTPTQAPFLLKKLSSLIYPADSKNLSAERLFGAILYTNLRTQNQRPSSKYFTKVLLILFPKINSNLRPSRRPPTQIITNRWSNNIIHQDCWFLTTVLQHQIIIYESISKSTQIKRLFTTFKISLCSFIISQIMRLAKTSHTSYDTINIGTYDHLNQYF